MADLNLDATTLLICCEVYQRYISACGLHSRQSVSAVISEDGRIEAAECAQLSVGVNGTKRRCFDYIPTIGCGSGRKHWWAMLMIAADKTVVIDRLHIKHVTLDTPKMIQLCS